MSVTVKLNASAIGGTIQTQNSGTVQVASDGTITVNAADVPDMLKAGCTYINSDCRFYTPPGAPAAANASLLFASAACTNGTKAVAAQPDVPRPVQAIFYPGTTAVTAGTLALTYVANDGTTVTDTFSLITAASTNLTLNSSKGVVSMTSQVVAAMAGGTSPAVKIGTTATLALPVPPGVQDVALIFENDAGTLSLGTTSGSLWTPVTAPNATVTYTAGYTFIAPNS
jgi:hypothetical protein